MRNSRFHVQLEKRILSSSFKVESIDFASLANCFYVQCASSAAKNFHTAFRILEAIDYFYTKELNEAESLPDAITCFLKNFSCAFGVFRALQSCISGNAANCDTVTIVVYGKNATDVSVYKKYEQLVKHGIANVRIYVGGMFEWLLLQDIYGQDLFPTTGACGVNLDILAYRPTRCFGGAT